VSFGGRGWRVRFCAVRALEGLIDRWSVWGLRLPHCKLPPTVTHQLPLTTHSPTQTQTQYQTQSPPPDPLKAIGFAPIGKKGRSSGGGGGGGRTEELTDLEKHAVANPIKHPRAKERRIRERVQGPAALGNVRKGTKAAKQSKRRR